LLGCPLPISTDELAGDITRPVGVGGSMWKGAFPVTEPDTADTVTIPALNVVSSPVDVIVARVGSDVDQFAVASGFELPSENVPDAANCCVSPAATDGFGAITVIDCRLAESIRKGVLPVVEPEAASTLTVPGLSVVSSPVEVIVARVGSDVDQFVVASSFVVPSE